MLRNINTPHYNDYSLPKQMQNLKFCLIILTFVNTNIELKFYDKEQGIWITFSDSVQNTWSSENNVFWSTENNVFCELLLVHCKVIIPNAENLTGHFMIRDWKFVKQRIIVHCTFTQKMEEFQCLWKRFEEPVFL
jgi:hypothetical protein